jgi:hypothetical protein
MARIDIFEVKEDQVLSMDVESLPSKRRWTG